MLNTILSGHTSPETAYVVSDYPYGFRLRCKIRYWIETTKQGDRFCSQTTNPKITSTEVWNKPKKGTYCAVQVMGLDENNHVVTIGISRGWATEEEVTAFELQAGANFPFTASQKHQLNICKAINNTNKFVKVEIKEITNEPPEERESREAKQKEVEKIAHSIFIHELHKQAGA